MEWLERRQSGLQAFEGCLHDFDSRFANEPAFRVTERVRQV
ncbi:hypothetical protein HDG35_004261 [Paraburkholderia sp. JPY681]|uniref:Uncharacterized protein n=1 Tax=Paraburkholderia atlantica TaxID=2654982 RepID=D5WG56_PARAM|nr:hypothetical protein BC1002_5507 [Paraburkholderia atlantica]MBB5507983.1 hypothetical protein [Paraburkholderia atlantica]